MYRQTNRRMDRHLTVANTFRVCAVYKVIMNNRVLRMLSVRE